MSVDRPDSGGGQPKALPPESGGVPSLHVLEDTVKPPDSGESKVNENDVTINEDFSKDLLGKR